MSLANIVKRKYATYQLERKTGEGLTKGRASKTYSAAESIELAIIPVGRGDLAAAPEGTITSQDIKIYRAAELDIEEGSRLTYKGNKYEIRSLVSRFDNGQYSQYIGKRLNDSN
jgi:hypothetical protein